MASPSFRGVRGGYGLHEACYVLRVLAVSAKSGFRGHRPRVGGFVMKVALVQVGGDLGVAT